MKVIEGIGVRPLQVSKWVKISILLDSGEAEELMAALPPFQLYDLQRVLTEGDGIYDKDYFLEGYCSYLDYLKNHKIPPLNEFRQIFSLVWSVDPQALYKIATPDGRHLIKAAEPVIQTQPNEMAFSHEEMVFRPQIFGSNTISWGIQIGFPFLFMDSKTYAAQKTDCFPNMKLFRAFQQWMRHHSRPTPFMIDGKRVNSPVRIGRKCLSWIQNHPQLQPLGIKIFI